MKVRNVALGMQGIITVLEDGEKCLALVDENSSSMLEPIGYPTLWSKETIEAVFVSSQFQSRAEEKLDRSPVSYPRYPHAWIGLSV